MMKILMKTIEKQQRHSLSTTVDWLCAFLAKKFDEKMEVERVLTPEYMDSMFDPKNYYDSI